MSAEHTRWEVSPMSDTMVQDSLTKRAIATTSVFMSSDDIEGCDATNVFHARLIAAAPDLLAACLAYDERVGDRDMGSAYLTDMIRAAIAKATQP